MRKSLEKKYKIRSKDFDTVVEELEDYIKPTAQYINQFTESLQREQNSCE